MQKLRYSVIIPAYNAERTLRRCLDSIVNQLPEDAELLLINDGSDDGTEILCHAYEKLYPQIRYIFKQNGGVSSARNTGLEMALGDYVLFVDADDAVVDDYFQQLDLALIDLPDLLLFKRRQMEKPRHSRVTTESSNLYTEVRSISRLLSDCMRRQELNLITTKAFRREIIEAGHIRFDERLDIGEDKTFAFAFALCSAKVKSLDAQLYFLSVDNPESLSRKKRDRLCESILLEHRLMQEVLRKADIPKDCKDYYQNALSYSFYRSAYTVVGELRKFDLTSRERRKRIRDILGKYSNEKGYNAVGFLCRLIALPVQKKREYVIDSVVKCSMKRGNR